MLIDTNMLIGINMLMDVNIKALGSSHLYFIGS